MAPLLIEPTEFTPRINFDIGRRIFEMSGESRPEDIRTFFVPVFNWLGQLKDSIIQNRASVNLDKITFNIKLNYFNSSSAKYVMSVLDKLEQIHKSGLPVEVNWSYDIMDVEMKETGEEFEKLLDIRFHYISYED